MICDNGFLVLSGADFVLFLRDRYRYMSSEFVIFMIKRVKYLVIITASASS